MAMITRIYKGLRPLFFLLDPERAHHLAAFFLKRLPDKKQKSGANFKIGEIPLSNPIGMAAGFDKTGELSRGLSRLGFGFSEIGTFTPRPQAGNPRPRIFRAPKKLALLNRMGFNNPGIEAGLKNLAKRPSAMPVGISIGKQKETPNGEAVKDYVVQIEAISSFLKGFPEGSMREGGRQAKPTIAYIAINISSPNTPGLRELQQKKPIVELVKGCKKACEGSLRLPLFIKLAPDFAAAEGREGGGSGALELTLEAVMEAGADGVIVTNTTTEREVLGDEAARFADFSGGISGAPLREKAVFALEAALRVRRRYPHVKVISSGGVMSPEDAAERLEMGADLVQVYSGFIYNGPGFAREIAGKLGV